MLSRHITCPSAEPLTPLAWLMLVGITAIAAGCMAPMPYNGAVCSEVGEGCESTRECCSGNTCDLREGICIDEGALDERSTATGRTPEASQTDECALEGESCVEGLPCCQGTVCDGTTLLCRAQHTAALEEPAACGQIADACGGPDACCAGLSCDPVSRTCEVPRSEPPPPECAPSGASCSGALPCCSGLSCDPVSRTCGAGSSAPSCPQQGEECNNWSCCPGFQCNIANRCERAPTPGCFTALTPCQNNTECCSGVCLLVCIVP